MRNQQTIYLNEIQDIMKMIDNRKACGPDGIPGELIKYNGNSVSNVLNFLITSI